MRRNVLSELRLLKDKIIDDGSYTNSVGEVVEYNVRTRKLFMRLSDFVRHGAFLSSKTQKFVAQYYDLNQSELASYWEYVYPNEQSKAESTFRTQCQNVNRILASMLPEGLIDMFINQEEEKLSSLEKTLNVLDFNDIHIEQCLGSTMNEELSKLRSPYKKYEVGECLKELKLLADMSQDVLIKRLKACDSEKLAFAYNILRKPNFSQGEPCLDKVAFLKEYLRFYEGSIATEGSITTEGGTPDEHSIFEEEDNVSVLKSNEEDTNSSGTSEIEEGILDVMKEYVGDETFTEDTLTNPDILTVMASATKERLLNSLKSFPKEEVAYIIHQFESGNDLVIDLYRSIINDGGSDFIGDYKFLPTVAQKISDLSEGCSPSSEASPQVAQVFADYLLDTAIKRLELLDPSELARGYADLKDKGTTTKLVDKFCDIDIDTEERKRLEVKHEIM